MELNYPNGSVKYLEKVPGRDGMVKPTAQAAAFRQQLLERVAAMPGVESVGMITILPPMGAGDISFSILGRPAPSPENRRVEGYNEVSSGYFRTMRIPLKRGRYLDDGDTQSAPWVVVISETLARRYFPNEDPIGHQMLLRFEPDRVDEDRPRRIVGVVGEVKQIGLGGLHPLLYVSFLQQPAMYSSGGSGIAPLWGPLVIRTVSDVHSHEADLTAWVKQAVRELDTDQPVMKIRTIDQVMWKSISGWRFYVLQIGVFAGMAVLLAAIGVYGVMSYSVNQRTRELGIRLALGAQRSDVFRMVAKLGLKLAGTGVAIGVPLALWLTRLITGRLYGVQPTDPWTYFAVAVLLLGIALLASYVPARRATKLDPMVTLRYE